MVDAAWGMQFKDVAGSSEGEGTRDGGTPIYIGEVHRLVVGEGETLVITVPDDTDLIEVDRIRRVVRQELPAGTKCIIKNRSVKMEVVTNDEE